MQYLTYLKGRLEVAWGGQSMVEKARLLFCAAALSVPRVLTVYLPSRANVLLRRFADRMASGTVTNVGGLMYALVDAEAFRILNPVEELWMRTVDLRGEGTFLDVGAHIGKYSLRFAEKHKRIIAIEPHPANFLALLKGIALNRLENVTALNMAGWDKDKTITLFLAEQSGWHSVKSNTGKGSILVSARQLDGVLDELGVEDVRLVKIDVEGAEPEVLKGLVRTLDRCHPDIIVENSRSDSTDVKRFLEAQGYDTRWLDGANLQARYRLAEHCHRDVRSGEGRDFHRALPP